MWIMFWAIIVFDGVSSGSQEFTSKDKCDLAVTQMKTSVPDFRSAKTNAWCVKK